MNDNNDIDTILNIDDWYECYFDDIPFLEKAISNLHDLYKITPPSIDDDVSIWLKFD